MTCPPSLIVNGERIELERSDMTPLLSLIRGRLGLLGAKLGCGEGRCGACTVLVDDSPVVSCLYPVGQALGCNVRTVESLTGPDEPLTTLQDRLIEHAGLQCGACTPGILMSLTVLLEQVPTPTENDVRTALAGNVCRCTGYSQIVDAVLSLSDDAGSVEDS